jgi:hypothetical protein
MMTKLRKVQLGRRRMVEGVQWQSQAKRAESIDSARFAWLLLAE